jgi:hypothetical protein
MSRAPKMILIATLLAFAAFPARAGGIEVSGGWTRATARGASVGAGYLTIDNRGGEADTLKGAACDRAERVEIHRSREENGVMTMRAAPNGVEIEAGGRLQLQPGDYHLMMVGLKSAFLPDETVHVTLHFAKGGDVGADLQVVGFGAQGPADAPQPK